MTSTMTQTMTSARTSTVTALMQVSDLSYRYPRSGSLLDSIDFSLYAGDRVALMGANGAGKTTFLHLLVGLKKAKAGNVMAFGRNRIAEADFVEVRAKAGFLFQDPDDQLFCPTVLEDVAFGPLNMGKSREQALAISRETLASLGMVGFEARVAHQLSGGEKRMVTLASVLAMEPEVLLLDEPSNALDTDARKRLIEILQSLPQAMIIISHDDDFLTQLATRRVCLENGKLSELDAVVSSELDVGIA